MTRDEALAALSSHERELRHAGLSALYLFGSTARDEATPQSDIDLLFEVDQEVQFSLMTQAKLKLRLEHLLGSPVDLVERTCLRFGVEPDAGLFRVF